MRDRFDIEPFDGGIRHIDNINGEYGWYDDIEELEQLLKECVVDKDILKYDNMKLESEKSELLKLINKVPLFSLTDEELVVLNKYKDGEG